MPFFIRAAVEALRAFPTVNSSVDGTNIVLHKECNIGIAVALDWGLIVPCDQRRRGEEFLRSCAGSERTSPSAPERKNSSPKK